MIKKKKSFISVCIKIILINDNDMNSRGRIEMKWNINECWDHEIIEHYIKAWLNK